MDEPIWKPAEVVTSPAPMPTRKYLVAISSTFLALAGAVSVLSTGGLTSELAKLIAPTLAAILIFAGFSIVLRWQVGDNLFGELGFMYLGLALAYTVFPALVIIVANLNIDAWALLAQLLPTNSELGAQLWRQALFMLGVSVGYLLVRGRNTAELVVRDDREGKDGRTIVVLVATVLVCLLLLTVMSAPVESYIDNYTRYDHLAWLPRKLVSLITRLKFGVYTVLLTFLFLNYRRYKRVIPAMVLALCVYETVDSFGARITSLIVLMASLCLYNYTVKPVTLKRGVVACAALVVLFSGVELVRSSGYSLQSAREAIADEGVQPAGEFAAVYFTGFHLYQERAARTLPTRPWPMFFYDFLSPFVFSDYATRWDPAYWYARNYFPDAVVPPQTLGPIALSAIWGGEMDLLIRSLVNGMFFAWLVRWFLVRREKWWCVVVYVYCYATSVMTLKYSVFYVLTPLVKSVFPSLLIVVGVRRLMPSKPKVSHDGIGQHGSAAEPGASGLRPVST